MTKLVATVIEVFAARQRRNAADTKHSPAGPMLRKAGSGATCIEGPDETIRVRVSVWMVIKMVDDVFVLSRGKKMR